MDTNYGIFTNEDGSKELIELTNEEFDAIVEAREAMESVNESDDEAINEFKEDIKRHYAARRLDEKQSGAHKNRYKGTTQATDNEIERKLPARNANDYKLRKVVNKAMEKAINKGNQAQDEKRTSNIMRAAKGKKINGGNSRATGRDEFEYQVYRNTKKNAKDAVKESVLDWYNENGIEIDDYEMGRIDSFVENYVEENF